MSEVKIKELDKSLIHQANSNSMSGKRGDISAHEYEVYCQKVMSWNIPDNRKQKIVDQIYTRWSEQLRHEAAHVSVAVAGPARYNAKKLDHSDTILRLSSEFVEWFNGLQEQVWQGRIEDKDAKEIARLVDDIKFCIERPTLNPTASLCELANKDQELFMEYYEKLHEKYRWRKNSVIAKLYAAGKEGKLANLNRQKFFEDENLVAYTMGDRAYIKFVMKPRQQLIVALKSRKWWWNSYEEAWSTYLNKQYLEWEKEDKDLALDRLRRCVQDALKEDLRVTDTDDRKGMLSTPGRGPSVYETAAVYSEIFRRARAARAVAPLAVYSAAKYDETMMAARKRASVMLGL